MAGQAGHTLADAKMVAPARFGIHWKPERGKLYRFRSDRVEVIRPWPRPRAWRKTTEHGWRGAFVHSFLQVTLPGGADRPSCLQHHLERPAWCTIPDAVRSAAVQATLNDSRHQFQVLAMLGHCPDSLGLAREVPLLAGALAASACFKRRPVTRPWRSVRRLLADGGGWRTWRRAAAWLDLPADKAFVRTLRRAWGTGAMAWAPEDLHSLRAAWTSRRGTRWILHAPEVTPALAKVVGVGATYGWIDRIHPSLLAQAGTEAGRETLWWRMPSFAATWRQCRPAGEPPPILRDVAQLEAIEAELWEARNRRVHGSIDALAFPEPPLPGDPAGITPLDSPAALEAEGVALEHCLKDAGWTRQARLRRGYGYAVDLPEGRATAWISQAEDGTWTIAEFRARRNAAPPLELAVRVHAWLARVALGGPRPWGPVSLPAAAEGQGYPGQDDDIPF